MKDRVQICYLFFEYAIIDVSEPIFYWKAYKIILLQSQIIKFSQLWNNPDRALDLEQISHQNRSIITASASTRFTFEKIFCLT